MKKIVNSNLIRLLSFMWKNGGTPLLGISYIVALMVLSSQQFLFNF
ncbi:hypothetical protein [Caldicellulosiruptor hydrothermalis]|nr:hypothetical protein [Caldicellulosiruptor hydrothermalis]